ncbi:hypothetical protein [Streptomyces ziwulingensis]
MRRRVLGGVSVAVALVLSATATACTDAGSTGSGAGPAPEVQALRAVERAVGRAGSARVESTTVIGGELSIEAAGALGWRDGVTGTLTITYTGGTSAETLRDLGTTSMQARYLPDAYYARMGDGFADRAGGRHWIKYGYADLERLDGDAGAGFADQMRSSTPHRTVRRLLRSEDVRKVGVRTLRGRRTTHWSGTVDGPGTPTVDIWVDDRDLLVKKVEKGGTAAQPLTQTAHYRDYGVRTSAERPPADDTADFTELLGGPGSGG